MVVFADRVYDADQEPLREFFAIALGIEMEFSWQIELANLGLVALAAGCGAIVGIEREFADKPAGLRTHMIVCAASAMLMLLGDSVIIHFQQVEGSRTIDADPIRLIQAIVIGISFLGAGTIFHQGNVRVEGLTTAASILLTSGIGIAVALGQVIFAAGTALLTVSILVVVGGTKKLLWGQSDD